MLENIIKKTKIGLTTAVLTLGICGCATTNTKYPLAEKLKQYDKLYECGGDNNRNLYCDDTYVYPLVVVKFK